MMMVLVGGEVNFLFKVKPHNNSLLYKTLKSFHWKLAITASVENFCEGEKKKVMEFEELNLIISLSALVIKICSRFTKLFLIILLFIISLISLIYFFFFQILNPTSTNSPFSRILQQRFT